MRAILLVPLSMLCALIAPVVSAEPDVLKTSPTAAAFGAAPLIWGARLSPDGERLSFIQMHPSGISMARVLDIATGTVTALVAGNADELQVPREVAWCGWVNDTRLVCRLRSLGNRGIPVIVAVDRDGGDVDWFPGRRFLGWLPDSPDHVLVSRDFGFAHLNVYNGALSNDGGGPRQVVNWMTDGHGVPRLYRRWLGDDRWYVRPPGADWSLLHKKDYTDTEDEFTPIGFDERGNELLILDGYEGRLALFAIDFANNRSRRLIYAHDSFDLSAVQSLGKYDRFVAATYIDDRPRYEFLDERIEKLHTDLQARFVGKNVELIDEDWSQRYYLIFVDGADDPGAYYRVDSTRNALLKLLPAYPSLAGRALAPMREIHYPASDGTMVPAYLTMPNERRDELPPAVILPHDGPATRDYLRFDFLAQYLAASGYAVLQSNYRGSSGYGDAWAGQGGYRDWRRAVGDIAAGTEYLVREGIVDGRRICAVGWGYGGYAALMSVIVDANLYRCVVSIAGVSDPRSHGASLDGLGGDARRAFIGTDDEVLAAGSPLMRVEEIAAPTLLFHGERDFEVFIQQSTQLSRALRRAGRDSELVRYEYAEHEIGQERYRVDLLTRLTEFLDEHLAPSSVEVRRERLP
jgi:dipeptidyl aminopeptidase/acylaminoacyl peptidase